MKLVYWLTVGMVVIGLINMTPGIPGYDDLAENLTGVQGTTFRKFPFEWFYPAFFALMMLIVALKHSMWRSWAEASLWRRRFGLFMDLALVLMAATISVTYFVEIEAICLIDQFTGDRARLIEESLKAERDLAELLGMEPPTTIDDPKCVNNTGGWLVLIVGLAIVVFLSYNIKVWGLPLVLVAILIATYTIITVLVWYFHGPDDINKYLMTKLAGEPRMLADGPSGAVHGYHPEHNLPVSGSGIAFRQLRRRTLADQACLSLDAASSRRAGTCRRRVLGHVRNHFRRPDRECPVDRGSDNPDDAETRFLEGVCRRG